MERKTRGMLLGVLAYGVGMGDAYAEDRGDGEEVGSSSATDGFFQEEQKRESIADAIVSLQPWYSRAQSDVECRFRRQHLNQLVKAIHSASKTHAVHPLLSVAVAFRESSLMPQVGLGARTGARGDIGYFQIIPGSAAQRVCDDCDDLYDPMCNASIALCYMKQVRAHCGSPNPWIWVGGYGRSRCPRSLREARTWGEVRRARSIFCKIHHDCDAIWPA